MGEEWDAKAPGVDRSLELSAPTTRRSSSCDIIGV
jgi:hypothetical protein